MYYDYIILVYFQKYIILICTTLTKDLFKFMKTVSTYLFKSSSIFVVKFPNLVSYNGN